MAIHHSKDLAHWRLIGHALTDRRLIDLRGVPDSGGVWAPQLSYHGGRFYLIYSNMRCRTAPFKDVHNYLTTAEHIQGPWSDPVYLNSTGFDPSLFHDGDESEIGPNAGDRQHQQPLPLPHRRRAFVEAWNTQGPAHHCTAGTGDLADRIGRLGRLLGM